MYKKVLETLVSFLLAFVYVDKCCVLREDTTTMLVLASVNFGVLVMCIWAMVEAIVQDFLLKIRANAAIISEKRKAARAKKARRIAEDQLREETREFIDRILADN